MNIGKIRKIHHIPTPIRITLPSGIPIGIPCPNWPQPRPQQPQPVEAPIAPRPAQK